MNNNNIKVFILCFISLLVICGYGKYRCNNPNYHDPLMKKIAIGDLDGWSITHFLFFATIGYVYPDTFYTAMGLGVGWELFEQVVGKNRPGFLGGFGDCITTDPNTKGEWWYGRLSDLLINLLGFIVGAMLSPYN